MDKKKVIYIGSLFILTVIVSITYFSYAFFTNRTEQRGKLNIVTGTLDYKIKSADLTNNSITLEANKSKQIEIEITSLNKISSKYELYYQTTASNIVVGYGSSNDTPTGTINSNGKKTVKLVIKNKSNSQATIVFGVEGGFISNELLLSTGSHITDIIDNICNYNSGYVWNFPFDPDRDGQGQVQEFEVPCDGYYKVELWGAQGGTVHTSAYGGSGGYTSGYINLDYARLLYVYVGEMGKNNVNNYSSGAARSYNGGGKCDGVYSSSYICAAGGGATDIRLDNGEYDSFNGLKSRIMVAAGGGGSYNYSNFVFYGIGGHAGGLTGYAGYPTTQQNGTVTYTTGYGASQKSGGSYDGAFGQGADGTVHQNIPFANYSGTSGGGGGGYYGGGAGTHVSGGGGGSSFISGHTGCNAITQESTSNNIIHTEQSNHYSGLYFTETKMIDGSGYSWTNVKGSLEQMPNPNGGYYASGTGNTGNGYARITYLGNEKPVALIPVMTSNTAPSGTASGSSLASQYYDHYYAFCDGICISNTPGNAWVPAINDTNPYIQYEFPTAVMAKKATVHLSQTYVTGGASPTYTIKASNDNVNWTTLTDVVTGTLSEVEIDLSNNSSYKYYRLQFNQSINQSSSVGTWRVYKLQLYGY